MIDELTPEQAVLALDPRVDAISEALIGLRPLNADDRSMAVNFLAEEVSCIVVAVMIEFQMNRLPGDSGLIWDVVRAVHSDLNAKIQEIRRGTNRTASS